MQSKPTVRHIFVFIMSDIANIDFALPSLSYKAMKHPAKVVSRKIAVDVLRNTHNRHPAASLWGRGGCFFSEYVICFIFS